MNLSVHISLMYNHFPFMAPNSTPQDDYYAQMQSAQKSGGDDKKPLKIKLKPVIKKVSENTSEAPVPESQTHTESTTEIKQAAPAPKARLVEREHASEGLLRSVMKRDA